MSQYQNGYWLWLQPTCLSVRFRPATPMNKEQLKEQIFDLEKKIPNLEESFPEGKEAQSELLNNLEALANLLDQYSKL